MLTVKGLHNSIVHRKLRIFANQVTIKTKVILEFSLTLLFILLIGNCCASQFLSVIQFFPFPSNSFCFRSYHLTIESLPISGSQHSYYSLGHSNTVSHVLVTVNLKIIFIAILYCTFAAVMNCDVNT